MKKQHQYAPLVVVGVLAAACAFVWCLVYAATPRGVLTVAVLNIGQGDSIYIESPTGEQVIIDGGPDNSLLRELPRVMPPFDRSIDAIISTHPDADHYTGFIDLLSRYQVGAFIEPGIEKHTTSFVALEQEVADEKIPRYIARRGMMLDLGGGAQLEILYPDHDVSHLAANMDNNGGVVARLTYGNTSALFTADVDKTVEDRLIKLSMADAALSKNTLYATDLLDMLKSNLLLAGHHGSRTTNEDAFIALVHPTYAAVSVGANNKYHLPNQEPLDSFAKYGATILRTDQQGTLIFRSDGTTFSYTK